MTDISPIKAFLLCETPQAWVDKALQNIEILLVDHANCEKKAASTALNLMYRYVSDFELLNKMSRLAREELRHFEQVVAIIKKRKIPYPQIEASRYAATMRQAVSKNEPQRLIDTLIIGAIIEARSCPNDQNKTIKVIIMLKKFYVPGLLLIAIIFTVITILKDQATAKASAVDLSEQGFYRFDNARQLKPVTLNDLAGESIDLAGGNGQWQMINFL